MVSSTLPNTEFRESKRHPKDRGAVTETCHIEGLKASAMGIMAQTGADDSRQLAIGTRLTIKNGNRATTGANIDSYAH